MKAPRIALLIALTGALSACVVLPTEDKSVTETDCHTFTKLLTLKMETLRGTGCSDDDEAGACLATLLVVGAGSVVVSGSIMLTGNTLHWLEYQGRCDDGYLNIAKQRFRNSLGHTEQAATKH